MDRFKFTYKNYGLMKMGYDISMLKLDLTKNIFGGNITVELYTGKLKIVDEMYFHSFNNNEELREQVSKDYIDNYNKLGELIKSKQV